MVGVEKEGTSSSRSVGRCEHNLELLRPTFMGPHYKFTLLLPVTEKFEGEKTFRPVFTQKDVDDLERKFDKELNGVTISKGPIMGSWRNDYGKVVLNQHVRLEVYTKLDAKAIEHFGELKVELLLRARTEKKMPQEDIVIEWTTVDFVPKHDRIGIRDAKEKLKNLKR